MAKNKKTEKKPASSTPPDEKKKAVKKLAFNPLALPEDRNARQKALKQIRDKAIHDRGPDQVNWAITHYYLRGVREFSQVDMQSGNVHPKIVGGDQIPFRTEILLSDLATEVGRFLQLDVAPAVERNLSGLDALRSASISQAILDAAFERLGLSDDFRQIAELLAQYGTAGHVVYSRGGRTHDIEKLGSEVVPPWELLPIPSGVRSDAQVRAICRDRWVPFEALSDLVDVTGVELPDPADAASGLEAIKRLAGSAPTGATGASPNVDTNTKPEKEKKKALPSDRGAEESDDEEKATEPDQEYRWYVRLQEYWVPYPNGRLAYRYVYAGAFEISVQTFEDKESSPMMPISVARRVGGVGFYGKSLISAKIPLSAEVEAAVLNLMQQAQNYNQYGVNLVPEAWRVDISEVEKATSGPKFVNYAAEAAPGAKVETIQPKAQGTMQAGFVNLGLGVLDKIGADSDIIKQGKAPGRVDSAEAISLLYRANAITLGQAASSIAESFKSTYKAILWYAKRWEAVPLNMGTLRDDSMLGVAFDPESGELDLAIHGAPDPVSIKLDIRSRMPKDVAQRKTELLSMLNMGLISQSNFKILARLEGLDFPLGNDSAWQNYRKAVLRNILLFGDGLSPGVLPDAFEPGEADDPEVHLSVINRLMSSPEFALAAEDVRNAFIEVKTEFEGLIGEYPKQMPPPEDLAGMETQNGPQTGQPAQAPGPATSPGAVPDTGGY